MREGHNNNNMIIKEVFDKVKKVKKCFFDAASLLIIQRIATRLVVSLAGLSPNSLSLRRSLSAIGSEAFACYTVTV